MGYAQWVNAWEVARHSRVSPIEHPDGSVVAAKVADTFIQAGADSVSFGFAVAGEENVSASVTFPTAFPTGVVPQVSVEIEGIDVGIVNVSPTETGFTITVRDDKGTDYTTAQTATVRWIAVAKSKS